MPPPQSWVGDGDDDGDGRIFPEHPSPILHAPRDIISRKGKSLTPIYIYIYIHNCPLKGIGVRDIFIGDLLCYAVFSSFFYILLYDSFLIFDFFDDI